MSTEEKFIDVRGIIASKNPKLLKRLPGFIIRYLQKVIHEKEINTFLRENKDKRNQEFCKAVVEYLNITIEVENLEGIPKEGKIVLAMNHPLGGMDALVLVNALAGRREDLKFIVNDILMNLENMKDMFVGVDKIGKKNTSLREQIINLFRSDQAVCIFPAGLVSRKRRGNVADLDWKKTFVSYSRENQRTIIPIYIDGHLSNFFYRLSNFRKFIGIKANIEMLYLSNELFKQRNRTIKFIVGDPVSKELMESDMNDHELAQEIKRSVYNLKNN